MRKKASLSSAQKTKIAIEAIKGESPLSEIARRHKVHAIQVGKWRKQLLKDGYLAFEHGSGGKREAAYEGELRSLYEQIGRLKVENDFLKKKSTH